MDTETTNDDKVLDHPMKKSTRIVVEEANEKINRENRKLILKKCRRELRGYTVASRICLVVATVCLVICVADVLTEENKSWEDLLGLDTLGVVVFFFLGFVLCKFAFTATKRDLKKKGPVVEKLWKRPLLFICHMWVRVCNTLARICFFVGLGLIGLSILVGVLFLVIGWWKDNGDLALVGAGLLVSWPILLFLFTILFYMGLNVISATFRLLFLGIKNLQKSHDP